MPNNKILLIKVDESFIEPSCSYPTAFPAYSHTFYHSFTLLSGVCQSVHRLEISLSHLKISEDQLSGLDIPSSHSKLDSILRSSEKGSLFLKRLSTAILNSDAVIVFGGLFSRRIPTALCSLCSFISSVQNKPTLRIGNFANIELLFDDYYPSVSHIGFIDKNPIPLIVNWLVSKGVISSFSSQQVLSNDELLFTRSKDLSATQLNLVREISNAHISLLDSRFLTRPTALKQRVLSVGFGCPQSCTFCPSRLTSSFSYNSDYITNILSGFHSIMPANDSTAIIDFLHADPLVRKDDFTELLTCISTASLKRFRFRIQTRLALIKSLSEQDIDLLRDSGVRIIYVGLETVSSEVSKGNKKYNNSLEDFLFLHKKLHDSGIALLANLVIGLPGETSKVLHSTLRYIADYPYTVGNIAPFRPIPGTPEGSLDQLAKFFQYTLPENGSKDMSVHYINIYRCYADIFQSRYRTDPQSPAFSHFDPSIRDLASKLMSVGTMAQSLAYKKAVNFVC